MDMFQKFDPDGTGLISASKVHTILSKSKVPPARASALTLQLQNTVLAKIWKLSDHDKYGGAHDVSNQKGWEIEPKRVCG